jgi:hypothetical protein
MDITDITEIQDITEEKLLEYATKYYETFNINLTYNVLNNIVYKQNFYTFFNCICYNIINSNNDMKEILKYKNFYKVLNYISLQHFIDDFSFSFGSILKTLKIHHKNSHKLTNELSIIELVDIIKIYYYYTKSISEYEQYYIFGNINIILTILDNLYIDDIEKIDLLLDSIKL